MMIFGTPGEIYSDDHIGGYFDEDGHLVVTQEYGLTDADTDKYSIQVQNGEGYYNENGKYVSFHIYDD